MRSWLRLAISFFVLCLVLVSFIYFFGPSAFRQAMKSGESPVGQLSTDSSMTSPGQAEDSK